MADEQSDGAAVSPKDPVTGRVTARQGPMERAGTEAEEEARGNTRSGEKKRPEPDSST